MRVSIPAKDEAIDELLWIHAESIASGVRPPREALHDLVQQVYYPHISHESVRKYVGDSRGLEQLIGAYWEYDDLPNEETAIPLFDENVRQLARDWLRRHDRVA